MVRAWRALAAGTQQAGGRVQAGWQGNSRSRRSRCSQCVAAGALPLGNPQLGRSRYENGLHDICADQTTGHRCLPGPGGRSRRRGGGREDSHPRVGGSGNREARRGEAEGGRSPDRLMFDSNVGTTGTDLGCAPVRHCLSLNVAALDWPLAFSLSHLYGWRKAVGPNGRG